MSKIVITCDDANDLGIKFWEENNISVLPVLVQLGEKEYRGLGEVTPQMIFDFVEETGVLPKTAARNIEEFKEFFKPILEKGYEIIHIAMSSKISSTYNFARLAAEELEGVYVIDSLSLSSGVGLQIIYCDKLIKQGLKAEEIVKRINNSRELVQTSFVVDTLDYLYKGGRCNGVSAFVGGMLKLRPQIKMLEGSMSPGKKYRGKMEKVVKDYVRDILSENSDYDDELLFVTHSFAENSVVESAIQEVKELTKDRPFKNIIVNTAGPTITSHCGKGTLGILYYKNGR